MKFLTKGRLQNLFFLVIILSLSYQIAAVQHADDAQHDDGEAHVETEHSQDDKLSRHYFLPEYDWKIIHPDDIVLTGLHYQMNFEKKTTEAKIMEGSDKREYYDRVRQHRDDVRTGKVDPNDGGFKITKHVKVPRVPGGAAPTTPSGWVDGSKSSATEPAIDAQTSRVAPVASEGRHLAVLTEGDVQQKPDEDSPHIELTGDKKFMQNILKLDDFKAAKDQINKEENPLRKFRTYEEIKKEMADANMKVTDEQRVVADIVARCLNKTEPEMLGCMVELEVLLHNIDNAKVFIDYDGIQKMLKPLLRGASSASRRVAASVATAALQNFPRAQIVAREHAVLDDLVKLLTDDEASVRLAALSSIGSLVRQFPLAQTDLVREAFPAFRVILKRPLKSQADVAIRMKLMLLLGDLLMERSQATDEEQTGQLSDARLEDGLVEMDWCHYLPHSLKEVHKIYFGAGTSTLRRRDGETALDQMMYAMSASSTLCTLELHATFDRLRQVAAGYRATASKQGNSDMVDYYKEKAQDVLDLISMIRNTDRSEL